MMKLKRFPTLFFSLAVLASLVYGQGKSDDDTIKIATRLVSVPVIVSDCNGRYIPNLKGSDFTMLQDGVPQSIEFFAPIEEPLTIALLIDTSQSTRPVLEDIKLSARSFIRLLLPQDRAMIVSFDHDTHVLSEITSNHDRLNRAVSSAEIPEYVGTTLRDATFQTVNRSFAGIKGRKAIIILTDGKDARSRVSSEELLFSLQETDTLIYTVMFKTGGGMVKAQFPDRGRFPGGGFPSMRNRRNPRRTERIARNNEKAEEFLKKLSDTTAGRFYTSEDGKLKRTFEMIVEELRFQYRLGFYPPEETDEKVLHELKVKVAKRDAVVRSRSSYRIQTKTN